MSFREMGVALAGLSTLLCSLAANGAENWSFSLTPYLWLPTIEGQLKFAIPPGGSGSPNLEAGPSDYLSDINSALMLAGEARKGRWSLMGDLIYINMDGSKANTVSVNLPGGGSVPVVDTGSHSSIKGSLITFAPGYSLYSSPRTNMDVFGGVRNLTLKAAADWRISGAVGAFPATGSIEQDRHITDGIIGVRGHVKPAAGGWSLPYYLDVGTGSSDFTWQGLLGASYSYSWGEVALSYRYLRFNMDNGDLINDLTFKGPMLGATFHF